MFSNPTEFWQVSKHPIPGQRVLYHIIMLVVKCLIVSTLHWKYSALSEFFFVLIVVEEELSFFKSFGRKRTRHECTLNLGSFCRFWYIGRRVL